MGLFSEILVSNDPADFDSFIQRLHNSGKNSLANVDVKRFVH